MKKKSCSILQCNVPYSLECGASGCLLCVLCALLLWLSCDCLQSNHLQWLPLLVMGRFGVCVVSGPVWSCLGWTSVGLDKSFARNVVSLNFRVVSLHCLLRGFHWWAGLVAIPNVCPQPPQDSTILPGGYKSITAMDQCRTYWYHEPHPTFCGPIPSNMPLARPHPKWFPSQAVCK